VIVDGHLDIAFNRVAFGRDPRESARAVRAREGDLANERWRGHCMVGRPEMVEGGVAVVFGTIFLVPDRFDELGSMDPTRLVYSSAEEAHRFGRHQLGVYRELHDDPESGFRLVGGAADLDEIVAAHEGPGEGEGGPDIGIVPLMEGADPVRHPDELAGWFERGLRIVGLAWKRTRYSGGTGDPGPLTPEGRKLVPAISEAGLVLDLSHASEESFFEALDLSDGPVIASHSNPRALCPGDRQLSDDMIRAIARRDGVVGCVPFNPLLVPDWRESGKPRVPVARVAEAVHHTAQVAGRHDVVAIGSDFDGGFGADEAPHGLDTIADLPRIADPLSDLGFPDEQIRDILGGNWIGFLRRALPAGRGSG
jgi:membrane dipeptidase